MLCLMFVALCPTSMFELSCFGVCIHSSRIRADVVNGAIISVDHLWPKQRLQLFFVDAARTIDQGEITTEPCSSQDLDVGRAERNSSWWPVPWPLAPSAVRSALTGPTGTTL